MNNKTPYLISFAIAMIAFIGFSMLSSGKTDPNTVEKKQHPEYSTFENNTDFLEYFSNQESSYLYESSFLTQDSLKAMEDSVNSSDFVESLGSYYEPRYSATNTQVISIDEPDILKTDGEKFYYAREYYEPYYYYDDVVYNTVDEPVDESYEGVETPTLDIKTETSVSDASEPLIPIEPNTTTNGSGTYIFDATGLDNLGALSNYSNFFLIDNIIVFMPDNYGASSTLEAYDISDPKQPELLWQYDMDYDYSYQTARLYDGEIYVIFTSYPDYSNSDCTFRAFDSDGIQPILCTDVWAPEFNNNAQAITFIYKINPTNGSIIDTTSFLVGDGYPTISMSENNIYVGSSYNESTYELMYDFIIQNADVFSAKLIDNIKRINSYDISSASKTTEVNILIQSYILGLEKEKQDEFQEEIEDLQKEYATENIRSFSSTSITQINARTLDIDNIAIVPGILSTQFAIDEYNGYVRVATTSQSWFMGASADPVNDVYILDDSLNSISEIKDLGINETIYAIRFAGDMAYLVTYRETDPFYVLDLSDPNKPELKGELKIPGYSSYLHPLTNDLIVGVGRGDGWYPKVSLFDISDPTNPSEIDYLELEGYSSYVEWNHHAFLHDADNNIFFVPTNDSGYIIKYDQDGLKVVFEDEMNAERAAYIDNTFTIFGTDKIISLDENTWKTLDEFTF